MAVVEKTVDIIGDEGFCDMILAKAVPENYPVDMYDDLATSLRQYALYAMTGLQSVKLSNVTKVGNYSLASCASLKSIDMEKCTQVGDNAFYDCLELDSIDMPLLSSASTRSCAL